MREAANDNNKREHVYFISSPKQDAFKVGYSSGAPRLSAIRTGNPDPLYMFFEIPAGREVESAIHDAFGAIRIRGEWFKDDGLLDYMHGDLADLAHYATGDERQVTVEEALDMANENLSEHLAWIAAGRPTGEDLESFVP